MAASGRSTSPVDRPTVVQVQEQTHKLEGRVTGLERDMQHTLQLVEATSRTVEQGFAETRRMFHEAAERGTRQAADLHSRIDEQQKTTAQKGQVSWPLVISAIVASFAVGGVFVAFVNMSLGPIRTDIVRILNEDNGDDINERAVASTVAAMQNKFIEVETQFKDQERRIAADERWRQWWFESIPEQIFTTKVKVEDAHFEIEKLYAVGEVNQIARAKINEQVAETHGRVEARAARIKDEMLDLRQQLRASRPDPFYGREGDVMERRIRELEAAVREAAIRAKDDYEL